MKKIAILSAVNIKHMSLVSLYTTFLKAHNIPYDIIYMDKYDEQAISQQQQGYSYNYYGSFFLPPNQQF